MKSGEIGDKRIMVKSRGWDGKPVLEIFDYNVQGGWTDADVLVDTIRYIN